MKTYIEVLLAEISDRPKQFFVGMCVFFVAIMGTSVQHVASVGFTLLVLFSFTVIPRWGETWRELNKLEKLFLGGLALYALSGAIAFINVQDVDEYIKDIERYLRFLLAIPVYLLVKTYRLRLINYLYVGAVASGPFLFYIAFSDYLETPHMPARGYYHHIIFGSVAMLNVGIMLSILLVAKTSNLIRVIVAISMLCGFVAAVLSQSRGVWLVLPVYILIALYYTLRHSKARFAALMILLVIGSGVLMTSPVGDIVTKRVDVAIDEVSSYYSDNQYISSLGTRLAMWDIAIDVWKQHPVIGSGPGDFDDTIRDLQAKGEYVGMDVHGSTHNIYMQALVNAGLFGLLTMLFALFIMPLKIVMSSRNEQPTKSLVGLIFIALFVTIGLSESWTLRLPTVSAYIIFAVVIISNIYLSEDSAEGG